jgi:hypothetical protein
MAHDSSSIAHAVPDASVVAKWHNPAEIGAQHASVWFEDVTPGQ